MTKPLAVATGTFQAGAIAPSANRIERASGSLTETLGLPFSASSLACVLARAAFSRQLLPCPLSPLLRCLQGSPLTPPLRCRGIGIEFALQCRHPFRHRLLNALQPFALAHRTPARARARPRFREGRLLVPSIAISSRVTSFSAISPVTLWVSRRSNNAAFSRRNPASRS
jgi:hypothetical protein